MFIGPPPEAIEAMGDKVEARKAMAAAGRAGRAGLAGHARGTRRRCARSAAKIGYPIMLKAAAGGGGKGMRLSSRRIRSCASALRAVGGEAKASFGDGAALRREVL